MTLRFIAGVLLWLLISPAYGQEKGEDTLKVLFVGNSYTYFWNLPQTVEAMADASGFLMKARKSTAGGTTWKQHWDGDKGLKSRKLIVEGNWDVVVLQNHSKSTLDDMEQFMTYGSQLIELVKSTGARPVLYETWAREFNPLMIKTIKKGYHQLGEEHEVDVVHIGELWEYTMTLRPDINLYDPDQSHPSTIGTYLTACAFYAYFTENNELQINNRISINDKNGELLYLSIMSEENAEFLQEAVEYFEVGGDNE